MMTIHSFHINHNQTSIFTIGIIILLSVLIFSVFFKLNDRQISPLYCHRFQAEQKKSGS